MLTVSQFVVCDQVFHQARVFLKTNEFKNLLEQYKAIYITSPLTEHATLVVRLLQLQTLKLFSYLS